MGSWLRFAHQGSYGSFINGQRKNTNKPTKRDVGVGCILPLSSFNERRPERPKWWKTSDKRSEQRKTEDQPSGENSRPTVISFHLKTNWAQRWKDTVVVRSARLVVFRCSRVLVFRSRLGLWCGALLVSSFHLVLTLFSLKGKQK